MGKDPVVNITPGFRGAITERDLLESEGSLYFSIKNPPTIDDGLIFNIADDIFFFCLSFKNNSIELQRNESICSLSLDDALGKSDDIIFSIIWTHDKLALSFSIGGVTEETETPTSPTAPPAILIKLARKNSLIATQTYKTEIEFREKIHSCLNTINEKVREADAYRSFWDFTYDGQKIIKRTPKKEIDMQPIIHCFLSDQMLLSSIEIIPEHKTGEGNLDFLFVGYVKDVGMCKFCAEFKRAQSEDLEHGLWNQLPKYMDVANATYGAYCVLNYEGDWFENPSFGEGEPLDIHLTLIPLKERKPVHKNIRCFIFSLGKHATASRRS